MSAEAHDPSARGPVRALPQSAADREWRRALSAAGFQVAPVMIPVHPSQLLNPVGDKRAAESAYREFVAAEPDNIMALEGLAFLLQMRGASEEVQLVRRRMHAAEARQMGVPDEDVVAVAQYLTASLGDGPAPASAPTAYVEKVFDRCAADYDQLLVQQLQYRGPELLLDAVHQVLGAGARELDVLDLGCGTGLAGTVFRHLARRQTGVDLSPAMLALARDRSVYDRLQQSEIVAFLEHTTERYGLVVAADVLNYLGDLSPAFCGVARVLRPGGHCALTAELGEDGAIRLRGMRRYQHSQEYIEQTAQSAGLTVRLLDEIVLRFQFSEPVRGWRAVLQRGG